jgi:hypothetical protein
MTEEQDKLRDAITAHPTMKRLSMLCDQLEKVLKRKTAGAEPDSKTGSDEQQGVARG